MTIFINKNKFIPLKLAYNDDAFLLLDIAPNFKYEDGKRTNKLIGYKYTVVDTNDFDKIIVKVEQDAPLLSPEELAELRGNGEKVVVEFVNAVDKLYIRRDGNSVSVEDSFSAEDILLVQQN